MKTKVNPIDYTNTTSPPLLPNLKRKSYGLERIGNNSDVYGACEICKKTVDSFYWLKTYESYEYHGISANGSKYFEKITAYRSDTFGHKTCLSNVTNKTGAK